MLDFVIIIVIIVAAVLAYFVQKWRREHIQRVAKRLGLQFRAEDSDLPRRYAFLDKLSQGRSRNARNILTGEYQGHPTTSFDFHYTVGAGKNKRNVSCSFFMLHLEKHFPELRIATEGLFSKFAQSIGFDDIDFESHEFSRKYVVRSEDKKFAYDVCNARMIEHLLASPIENLEIDGPCMALGFNRCISPDAIEYQLYRLVKIRERMPNYLFDG
ncbi:MAG: hypothetical protein QNI99_17070 [Woeseiaceae bacterium]|nr:hypothetical protein [Woeseiaceae bacterium]